MPSFTDIAGIATGIGGLFAGNRQNRAINAQNELARQQYEWARSKEAPGVEGAQRALAAGAYTDAEGNVLSAEEFAALPEDQQANYSFQSYFQPFTDRQLQQAATSGDIAQRYQADVDDYRQVGAQGLRDLVAQRDITPESIGALQTALGPNNAQAAYNLARDDINLASLGNRRAAQGRGGRFAALSNQKARELGQVEQQRQRELLRAATQATQADEAEAYRRAQTEIGRQAGLAGTLLGAGTTGLNVASSASNLGQQGYQQAIQAPFAPFREYGSTIQGQHSASLPTLQPTVDPLSQGLGAGLTAWSAFNRGQNN